MYGQSFGDMMHASADRDRAVFAASQKYQGWLDESKAQSHRMMDIAAGLYGQREALKRQMAMSDPENPLLKDASLFERIKEAATKAFQMAERDNFEVPREVGNTFAVPGREGQAAHLSSPVYLAGELERMKLAYAGSLALRKALERQLRDLDAINPVIHDYALVERIRLQGESAYKLSGDNFDAARDVGKTFAIPGR